MTCTGRFVVIRGFLTFAFTAGLFALGLSQTLPPGTVIKGEAFSTTGISMTVRQIQQSEGQYYPLPPRVKKEPVAESIVPEIFRPTPRVMTGLTYPDPRVPTDISDGGGQALFSIGTTFLGAADTNTTIPPDTHGAVGPTQVAICTNDRVRFMNKDGSSGPLNVSLNTFFASVASNVFDPRAKYDRLAGRWYVVAVAQGGSESSCIVFAVSSGATISSAASFTFYKIDNPATLWFDYPVIGMDEDAVYVTTNNFTISGNSFSGADVYSIRKSTLPGAFNYVRMAVASGNGFTFAPADNDRVPNSAGILATGGWSSGDNRYLRFYTVNNPGTGSDSLTIGNFVQVNGFGFENTGADKVPQKGSAQKFAANDSRLGGGAFMRRNPTTGVWTFWTAHNALFNTAGAAANNGAMVGSRWYEFTDIDAATPTVRQQGTLLTTGDANGKHYWFPSIAANGQGHAVLGSSVSDTGTLFGSVNVAARLVSDSLGTLSFNQVGFAGLNTYYKTYGGSKNRWGDYSEAAIDPADNQTMWVFQEYADSGANTWAVRAVKLLAPPPAAISTLVPNTANPGDTLNITVTGTSSAGTAFYDPGTGFPNRLAASLGAGITVNSVTFTNGTSITLNVTVAGGAAAGARTLTVTNPDGQVSSLANAFTVNSGSITLSSISPSSVSAQSSDTIIQLTGTNFSNTTVGQWNAVDRPTTFVNSTRVDMTLSAADLAFNGSGQIRARQGAVNSSALTFTINPATFAFAPNSVATISGSGKGSVSAISASDNVYYTVTGQGLGGRGYEHCIEGSFTLRPTNGTEFGFFAEVRSQVAVTSGQMIVELFNLSTGKWQRYQTLSHPTTSDTVIGVAGGFNGAFVSPSKTIRVRIRVLSDELSPSRQTTYFDRFYVTESY
jgi:hypothetical protein